MRKTIIPIVLVAGSLLVPLPRVQAQLPILEVIRQGITKIIIAIDLKIQRLQNETIWLQNAQKTLENELSKLKLEEIAGWVERQRRLYQEYFEELWKVKAALAYYHRVRDILEQQAQIVSEYQLAWALLRQDKNFTPDELQYMQRVYLGMLDESSRNLDQLMLVVNAFATQMSDARRLEIIHSVAVDMEQTLLNLRQFNSQNKLISQQRSAARGEIEYTQKLYGLE